MYRFIMAMSAYIDKYLAKYPDISKGSSLYIYIVTIRCYIYIQSVT